MIALRTADELKASGLIIPVRTASYTVSGITSLNVEGLSGLDDVALFLSVVK